MRVRTTAWLLVLATAGLVLLSTGCVTLPKNVEVNVGDSGRPAPVDSTRVPEPKTLDEAHQELVKAYQNLQYLEHENARLADKAAKYKTERDECRKRLKSYERD